MTYIHFSMFKDFPLTLLGKVRFKKNADTVTLKELTFRSLYS